MTVKERIRAILSASRAARNSDLELWIIYANKSGMELTERQIKVLRDMPSMETLRRTRQVIQNTEGTLRPDPEIDKARFAKYKEMKQVGAWSGDPEKSLESLGYKVREWGDN